MAAFGKLESPELIEKNLPCRQGGLVSSGNVSSLKRIIIEQTAEIVIPVFSLGPISHFGNCRQRDQLGSPCLVLVSPALNLAPVYRFLVGGYLLLLIAKSSREIQYIKVFPSDFKAFLTK
jgi:hypothetical protein